MQHQQLKPFIDLLFSRPRSIFLHCIHTVSFSISSLETTANLEASAASNFYTCCSSHASSLSFRLYWTPSPFTTPAILTQNMMAIGFTPTCKTCKIICQYIISLSQAHHSPHTKNCKYANSSILIWKQTTLGNR